MLIPALAGAAVAGISNLIGAKMQSDSTRQANERNEAMQREFAQQGLRWRVEDAKAAGLHPLAALGTSVSLPAPVHVGDMASGDAIARTGSDISRAITSASTRSERMMDLAAAESLTGAKLANEGQALENEILRSRLRLMSQPGTPPPRPSLDAPNAAQPGSISSVQWSRNMDGSYTLVPSKDIKERIEDNDFLETAWNARNIVGPAFFGTGEVPNPPLPRGASHFEYEPKTFSLKPRYATPTPTPGQYGSKGHPDLAPYPRHRR